MSISGDTLVIRAPSDGVVGKYTTPGAAYIYRRNQGGADNWGQVKKVTPPEGDQYNFFGRSVSISGSSLAVGEPGESNFGLGPGRVFIYYRNQGGTNNWGYIKNVAPGDGGLLDGYGMFGMFVSVDGDTLLIGAPFAENQIGAAYIFRRDQGGTENWGQSARIAASDPTVALYGNSVSVDGDTFVIGAWGKALNGVYVGSAYVYQPVKLTLVTDVDSLTVLEGSSASFQVKLGAQPPSDVIVSVSRVSGDEDVTVQSGGTLTFTPSNWNVYQTVTLAAAEDADTANGSATIRLVADGIEPKDVIATEADNDFWNFVTNTDTVTVPEGGTAQFQVMLSMAPTSDVVVKVSPAGWMGGDEDITIQSGDTLTFTPSNWNVYQTVTLAAAKDPESMNGTAYIWIGAPGGVEKIITAIEADNDPVAPVIDVDAVTVPEGAQAYFHVKLGRPPPSDLTLNVSRMSGDEDITIYYGASLTFTPSNWDTYQTVTLVAAVDDDVCNGTATIRVGAPGAQPKYVTAIEADKDTLSFVTDVDALTVVEADTGNFFVRLNRRPCSDVVVSVTRVSGGSNFTVASGGTLTFTPANWNLDQSVTIAAAKDPDGIVETAIIRLSAAGVPDKEIKVTEYDTDPPQQIAVTDTDAVTVAVTVPEEGTATFQVKLVLKPESDGVVSVSRVSGDADIAVQSGGTLTFTTTNWNTYQTVTLAAAKDIDVCNNTATIRLSGTGVPPVVSRDVTATEQDNDVAQPLPFFDDFSTDKGWFGYRAGGWERGPARKGGGENGEKDPETDYSSGGDNHILGYAIGGDYPDSMEEESIISPPIDCSSQEEVLLKFRRWLNVEGHDSDHARIYISNDGTNWFPVWENPGYDLTDGEWVQKVIDISDYAGDQETVYIKFTMGPTNSSRAFSGWNIDDFEVTPEAIYPVEGTIGTEVWIPNDGYGPKKGKVLVGIAALKVLGWTDTLIHCILSKALPHGVYDLTIRKKVKGAAPVVKDNYFSVMPPEIESLSSDSGTAGETITLNGKFFGAKKPKVTIGGKSCKVTNWKMDVRTGVSEIKFLVPAGLSKGTYELKVINKVGSATESFTID